MSKSYLARDLWGKMCECIAVPDEGPVFECHPWTLEKLHFLCRYLATTTTAMVGSRYFSTVNYIDLFAGSGACRLKSQPQGAKYPGSPLLAAGCQKPFTNLFLVESNRANHDALVARLQRVQTRAAIHTWCGDANVVVDRVVSEIPSSRALNIVFVDPYSLDFHFSTIETLARHRTMDLIVLFADAIDIVRNVDRYYEQGEESKLDRFLGTDSGWRNDWLSIENREGGRVREFFASTYLNQLRRIGYSNTAMHVLESGRGPIYRLIYASKNKLGLKFWDVAVNEDWRGDRNLWSP